MSRKEKLLACIFFACICVCAAFLGVVEAQVIVKAREDVTVFSNETEIIEPTLTDKNYDRRFKIDNGRTEIIATVWGSNDQETWEFWVSKTIGPDDTDWIILGANHFWNVKLTGRTISTETTSIVDAYLHYREP